MNINWKVRLKNKTFWITLVPAILLVIQAAASVFNITIDLGEMGNKILNLINAIFVVLSVLGIVVDPTTSGVTDSEQAMTYTYPK